MRDNILIDLQQELYRQFTELSNSTLKGEALNEQIVLNMAINEKAKLLIANSAMIIKTVDALITLDPSFKTSETIPLIKGKTENKAKNNVNYKLIDVSKARKLA